MSRKARNFSTRRRLEPPANEILPMFEASCRSHQSGQAFCILKFEPLQDHSRLASAI